ncbi:MAG TPA: hypothetical protein VFB84_13940 [Micromonosporaceae bacterium]|nr:hypothetical protein [Micromonosporaceae bacterium]
MPAWRLVTLVAAAPVALAVAGFFHPDDLTVDTAREWTALHVVLLPLFPLLGGALVLLLRGMGGVVPAVARLAAYAYAVFYTGLDAVAGVGAGRVAQTAQDAAAGGAAAGGAGQTADGLEPVEPQLHALFDIGNALGIAGSASFAVAAAATAVALLTGYGRAALPGGLLLVLASIPFLYSHVYWPVGGLTMLALALALGLLAWVVAAGRADAPVTSSTGT